MKMTATKIGMSHVYDDNGFMIPVTLLQLHKVYIAAIHGSEIARDSSDLIYSVFCVYDEKPENSNKVTKPLTGVCKSANVPLCRRTFGYSVKDKLSYKVGDSFGIEVFAIGDKIKITSNSKGKGFAGGMKRHGFGGLCASHGVSLTHRSIGSTGQRKQPGKVFKGTKMPGHMGNKKTSFRGMKVFDILSDQSIICVIGSVPGYNGAIVFITTCDMDIIS